MKTCLGCGKTENEIIAEFDLDGDDLDADSITTDAGDWYCHQDCYRDCH